MTKIFLYIFAFIFFISFTVLKGEGTKEISPEPDMATFVLSREYSDFGLYGADESERIKISVSSKLETIYLGLNNKREIDAGGGFLPGVGFRVVSPSGKIVYSSDIPSLGEEGNIPSWDRAVSGPRELGNANGYDAIVIDPEEAGDYVLEFDTSFAGAPDHIGNTSDTRLNLNYLDITLADDAGKVYPGRLHSQGWQISTQNFQRPFTGKVYPLVGESAVYEVDLNGIDPFIFIINFNSYGVINSPGIDPLEARKSKKAKFIAPEFKVFLNPPDENLFPVKIKELKISGRANKVGCNITEFCFSSNDKAFLEGYLDFNGNNEQDEEEIQFAKDLDGESETCITWDGKDKNGNPIDKAEFKILSKVGFGMTHLPLFDVEDNKNGYIVKVVKPEGVPDPVLYWDDSEITEGQELDGLVNMNGCAAAQGCHKWQGRGDPSFNNQEEQETINTWWFSTIILDTIVYKTEQEEKVLLSYLPDEVLKTDSSICKGDSLRFYVFNDGNYHFDSQRYNYLWLLNDVVLTPDMDFQDIKMEESAEVVIQAIDRLGQFCTTSDTIKVTVVDKVELNSIVSFNCKENSGSIRVEIASGNPDSRFIWEDFPQQQTGIVNDLSVGQYNLKVVDPDFPLCSADTTFSIDPIDAFMIDSIEVSSYNCVGDDGEAIIILNPRNAEYEISKDNEDFQSLSFIENLQPGIHNIKVRDKNTLCEAEKTFMVPIEKPELVISLAGESCGNKNGRAEVSLIPSGGYELTWNGKVIENSVVENLSEGTYKIVSLSEKHLLCNIDSTVSISNSASVVKADFTINDKSVPDTIFVAEEIKFTDQSEYDISLIWDFGDGATSDKINVTHAYSKAGRYLVTLEATDEYGCKDIVNKMINIINRPPCGIAIPNAFSPNNDAENDSIGVRGNVVKMDLKVFNRWGEVIFRTFDIKDKWNGLYRGVESPIGVYPYILDYYCPGNNNELVKETLVGEITLVR